MNVNAILKRSFDILASLMGLVILAPLFLGIGFAVKTYDGGAIFYLGSRVGRGGKEFKLYKFRSMVLDADKIGPAVTGAEDKRITPIGRFLRKTKLDELPQLINVLVGDMSLVGPRPEAPKYVSYYNEQQRSILRVQPGLTSPASIEYRSEESLLTGEDWESHYIKVIMPRKLAIDLEYLENANLVGDIMLILRTILLLFQRV